MKRFFLFTLFVCYTTCLFAQRLPLDTSVLDKWPAVWDPRISNNGQYAMYRIQNEPVHSYTTVICSTKGNWEKRLPGVGIAVFADDSRTALFMQGKDSLCLLRLGRDDTKYIAPVKNFRLFKQGKEEWLAYQLQTPDKSWCLET